ncbi:hypothetical protein KJ359_004973 [Pestalotiopsis sp. 9143b]|nr:hypothetical protein KJ359_004973 [Pestalotiopsis sp. 9143b]
MSAIQKPIQHNGDSPAVDLKNIQGDIVVGFAKKFETFVFFRINKDQVASFRNQLRQLLPRITSAKDSHKFRDDIKHSHDLLDNVAINIAFSQFGLKALGINDNINDQPFTDGQQKSAADLGDRVDETWDSEFKENLDGVIIVAASRDALLKNALDEIKQKIFHVGQKTAGIEVVKELAGHVRPGNEEGHEHFGFNDGLTQPFIKDVTPHPKTDGSPNIPAGVMLLGQEGDNDANATPIVRPGWAKDGSFLAFRYLQQLVPEFDDDLVKMSSDLGIQPTDPNTTAADLLGARLVGRWKSGAPVDLTPDKDIPELAEADNNQEFMFSLNSTDSQNKCPYAAHIRKTNPRGDRPTEIHRIIRRGIQFGPEVTDEEAKNKTSSTDPKLERGLLFACYQSNLTNGFEFIQKSWVNAAGFPFPDSGIVPGVDPLIGAASTASPRSMLGADPADLNKSLTFPREWVIPKGGEYFFSPSISALKNTFAAKA